MSTLLPLLPRSAAPRRAPLPLAFALTLALTGCALPWHPFGTAVSKAEKAQAKVDAASARAGGALVEAVHKTDLALSAAVAGQPDALAVAQAHARTAVTLADQLHGPPTVRDESRWADLIARQTSLDAEVRRLADHENAARLTQLGTLSADLAHASAARDTAATRAVQAAAELQAFRDRVLRWVWIVGGLFALYFLGQFLQFLAHFNPAFEGAANLVNTFVSPALHSGFSKARKALAAARDAARS